MTAKSRARSPRSSELLQAKIRIGSSPLHTATDALWQSNQLPQLLPEFLASIYDSVRVTIPLMEAARTTAADLAAKDPVARLLPKYLDTHIAEEREHDQWLLKDLGSIGFTREKLRKRVPRASIAAMAGAQYYWILHSHPVAVLGYLAVLEGYPPTIAHLDTIRKRSGLPAKAFRMLRHHAEADEQHAADLLKFLDTLPLSDHQQTLVGMSALHTLAAILDFFQEIVAAPVPEPAKARA